MSAKRRKIRPADIPESLKQKMIHAIEDTQELSSRYMLCPYCKHPVMMAYSDAKGHFSNKCPKCGRVTIFDAASMRRASPQPLPSPGYTYPQV